jgi:phospholipase A2
MQVQISRPIKGWPIGAGWPAQADTTEEITQQLDEAQAQTSEEADEKIEEAKAEQLELNRDMAQGSSKHNTITAPVQDPSDLGYCNVWVGSTTERESTDVTAHTPSLLAEADDWRLMEPDAGITVIYFPFVSNPKVEGVDPVTSPCMSTWNFIYTPEDVDDAMALARANFLEGKEQTRRTVRAVYERKKKTREERERVEKSERFRRKMRLGVLGKKGEGDHFS